jgi:hypothetical protein
MSTEVPVAGEQIAQTEVSASHECPCPTNNQNKDLDGCAACNICLHNASLNTQSILISYSPFILDLHAYDPFKYLPEVHLPKFIPPEIHA